MKIKQEHHDAIEGLLRKQNQNALFLGIVEVEFEIELTKVVAQGNDLTRRGALLVEREERRAFLLESVRQTRAAQKTAGEAALLAFGIDPAKGEYMIDGDEVLQLVGGRWVTYETAQQFAAPEDKQ